jgi:hypothetical protein
MTATRIYRLQLLAMLSTGGQRARFDRPPTQQRLEVSLHRCGDVLAVRADSSNSAALTFDDATRRGDIAPEWTRGFYETHRGQRIKPGDVIAVEGEPRWQHGPDGRYLIPPQRRPYVAALIDPRSWRDTLCPFDAAVERGRRPRGLVAIGLRRGDLNAVQRALTDTASRPDDSTRQFVERQVIAHQRRRGVPSQRVTVRLTEAHVRHITRALLTVADEHDHHADSITPGAVGWARADRLRTILRRIQTQAAAQALDPPTPRDPAAFDLSW